LQRKGNGCGTQAVADTVKQLGDVKVSWSIIETSNWEEGFQIWQKVVYQI